MGTQLKSLVFLFSSLSTTLAFATPRLEIDALRAPAYWANSASSGRDDYRPVHGFFAPPNEGKKITLNVERNAGLVGAGYEYLATTAKFELRYYSGIYAPATVTTPEVSVGPLTITAYLNQYRDVDISAIDGIAALTLTSGDAIVHIPNILPPFIQQYYGASAEYNVLFGSIRFARKITTMSVNSDRELYKVFEFYPERPALVAKAQASESTTVFGISQALASYGLQPAGFQVNDRRYLGFGGGYDSFLPVRMSVNNGSSTVEVNTEASSGELEFLPDLANGTYTVTVSRAGMLTRIRTVTVSSFVPTLSSSLDLRLGDTDASGEIDAADIDTVIAAFGMVEGDSGWFDGTYPAYLYTDVDGSGEVDAADSDVITANYGEVSD